MHAYLIVLAMGPGMRPREFMPTKALQNPVEKLGSHDRCARDFNGADSSYHDKCESAPTP